jgi:hypothetical protein
MATRELQPPLPGHLWPKGSHTTHWPQWEGMGRLRPALPRLATYALTPTPADRGLRTGGLPTPRLTDWPKGGDWPPTPPH